MGYYSCWDLVIKWTHLSNIHVNFLGYRLGSYNLELLKKVKKDIRDDSSLGHFLFNSLGSLTLILLPLAL